MIYPLWARCSTKQLAVVLVFALAFVSTACAREWQRLVEQRPTPVPLTVTPVEQLARPVLSAVPAADVTPVPATMLVDLSTEEQLAQVVVPTRDLRDLTLRFNPAITEIPLVVNAEAPDYEVGTQLEFWVHNPDTNTASRTTAKLIYKTAVAYVWVESGQQYDEAAIIHSIDRFSDQSYPAEVAFFGSEWFPGVDNDPRVHILHATNVGAGVAGYYSSADEYSRLANAYSNEKEMFYINLNVLNRASDYEYYETVLAHEFQHMIHWYKDRNEETWLNEGLSEYAQEVAGYGADTIFANSFINTPDTQLNTWRLDTGNNREHYGASYLFVHYLTQRFGQETTKTLVEQVSNGIQGVTDALHARGYAIDFDDLFADWTVANYVEDPDALGQKDLYGYTNLDLATPPLAATLLGDTPLPYAATVSNYATDYVQLPDDESLVLTFQGQHQTRLANTTPHSGTHAFWSHRGDDSNPRLTRKFDLNAVTAATNTPLDMSVAMWWDIEADYDYGYVLASRDGVKWDMLTGSAMTGNNPSGNNLGIGYTDTSANLSQDGWVIQHFDLTPYAGEAIWIRFEYVTDDAANASGWLIDDLQIPAIGYSTDFESDLAGWESEGWLLTDNLLTQHWLLQVMLFDGDILANIERIPVAADGSALIALTERARGQRAILAISALTPISTEPASYQLTLQ